IEYRIGNGFADRSACDLADCVAATGDMLNIERCVNVDASIEQFEYVLVTFWMARPWRICMREFIDHCESRMPGQDRIKIHFRQNCPSIFNLCSRHNWHPLEQRLRFFATVRLDNPNDNFASFCLFLPRCLQHGIGLPHARRHPEKNLQFSARCSCFLAVHSRQDYVRARSLRLTHGTSLRSPPNPFQRDKLKAIAETSEYIVVRSAARKAEKRIHVNREVWRHLINQSRVQR